MCKLQSSRSLQQCFNRLGVARKGFVFWLNARRDEGRVVCLDDPEDDFYYKLGTYQHLPIAVEFPKRLDFSASPVSFEVYKKAFDQVQSALMRGDSYLLNLCFPTPLRTNLSLEHFFHYAEATYKILIKNHCVCFSPECFVKMQGGTIATYPMKGTISADLPDAAARLLADEKESCEHATVVDLLRNDLARVSTHVRVNRYRYLEQIKTQKGNLLQSSSEIVGDLPEDWRDKLGDILFSLLPAGSVTGAPKLSTCEVIQDVEIDERGYYTGVFGVFDGESLDSAVAIRYVEHGENGMVYRSGGGITTMSQAEDEYDEMIEKVYVPFTI